MSRRIFWPLMTLLVVLSGISYAAEDPTPWHIVKVSRHATSHGTDQSSDAAGPEKYLHVQVRINDPECVKDRDKFRIVDVTGNEVGEIWGYNEEHSTLIFEGEWGDLKGLWLDGFAHHEPLVPSSAAPLPQSADRVENRQPRVPPPTVSPRRSGGAVDLVTVPTRASTQLTIYNPEDITMVRERRELTVKRGVNRIQFSWSGTLIDPTSIDFRILDHQDAVDLIDTTFPAGRNDALQWNIESRIAGKVSVEIRYFTSGITWEADYVGIANADETKLNLSGYVRVTNNSGEPYDNAQTRLVVGNINLVEKIADLAKKRPPGETGGRDYVLGLEIDRSVATAQDDAPCGDGSGSGDGSGTGDGAGPGPGPVYVPPEKPKKVVKEGLSEYFLFTIEGRETIQEREPKRLVALKAADVPLELIYKLSDRTEDRQFSKFYRFKNARLLDESGKEKKLPAMENLGLSPLPNGSVRLFAEYANKDLAYVGGTETKYVPVGDRLEVNVGSDPDIAIGRRVKDRQIAHVVARQYKRRLNNLFVHYYDLVDYDETFFYEEELVSGKPLAAKVEVERRFDADVVLWGEGDRPAGWTSDAPGAYVDLHALPGRVERVDQQHVKYFMDLPPGKRQTIHYNVTYKRRKIGPELNAEKRFEPL